ncbi:MAG: HAD family phosphatase [Candidatus Wildermuthbacteria bacterium]|nr:HAD family phosphatase [Candidatus Wildermuthbacteria bacterium]
MPGPQITLVDVDDTIVPTDGMIPDHFYEGLSALHDIVVQANIGTSAPIVFSTGRDRNYVEACAFFVGLPRFWCVIESGVALFNPFTKEIMLNPALTPQVQAAFVQIRKERMPKIMERFPQLFEYPGNQIQLTLERKHGVREPIDNFYAAVRGELADFEEQGLLTVRSSKIAIDISPVGSDGAPLDKASGVRFLGQQTGIDPAKMLGIGDSRGDLPMFRTVGMVGCPTDASEECRQLVKERGGHLSEFRYASGVVDVIRHFTKS